MESVRRTCWPRAPPPKKADDGHRHVRTGRRIPEGRVGVEIKSARESRSCARPSRMSPPLLLRTARTGRSRHDPRRPGRRPKKRIRSMGATPSFKGYTASTASICASIQQPGGARHPSSKGDREATAQDRPRSGPTTRGIPATKLACRLCASESSRGGAPAESGRGQGVADGRAWPRSRRTNTLLDIAWRCCQDHVEADGLCRSWQATPPLRRAATCTKSFAGSYQLPHQRPANVSCVPACPAQWKPLLTPAEGSAAPWTDPRGPVVTADLAALGPKWEHTIVVQ